MKSSKSSSFVDYSHELKLARNPALRYLWLVLGLIFTGIGILGYILPGLPGTVFILIATYFFARSSARFYNWLLNNRLFGQLILDWRAGLGLPVRAKIMAVTVIALSVGSSAYLIGPWAIKLAIIACGLGVSIYLLSRPTKRI